MGLSVPDWRASSAGTRVRVALWLFSEVREGGAFTKAQLREAFPGVEQIDRRMRDLRAEGWHIATYREDRSLAVDELRLVTLGGQVWEPDYRTRQVSVSDADRSRALQADGYACRTCGVGAGEPYPDDRLRSAKLSVERTNHAEGGVYLRARCDRCMGVRSGQDVAAEATALALAVAQLPTTKLHDFAHWVAIGEREHGPSEVAWSRYCALPHEARQEIGRQVNAELQHRDDASEPIQRAL